MDRNNRCPGPLLWLYLTSKAQLIHHYKTFQGNFSNLKGMKSTNEALVRDTLSKVFQTVVETLCCTAIGLTQRNDLSLLLCQFLKVELPQQPILTEEYTTSDECKFIEKLKEINFDINLALEIQSIEEAEEKNLQNNKIEVTIPCPDGSRTESLGSALSMLFATTTRSFDRSIRVKESGVSEEFLPQESEQEVLNPRLHFGPFDIQTLHLNQFLAVLINFNDKVNLVWLGKVIALRKKNGKSWNFATSLDITGEKTPEVLVLLEYYEPLEDNLIFCKIPFSTQSFVPLSSLIATFFVTIISENSIFLDKAAQNHLFLISENFQAQIGTRQLEQQFC